MTRKKWILVASCFFSLVTFTTIALTQEETPVRRRTNPNLATINYPDPPSPISEVPNVIYPANSPHGSSVAYRQRTVARTIYDSVAIPISAEELKQLQAMQAAKEKLKKAQNEAARKEATDVIQKSLIKQFEQDLAQREKELAAAEERLKTLRQQLDKRKLAKDEIITLRLKTIVNNAEGLGFPGDEAPQPLSDYDTPVFGPYDPASFRRTLDAGTFQPTPDLPADERPASRAP
ncbi:MAG: hypothetical protein JWP89_1139 [Schlesneria sp.]|nr:hypothetical protein [Schlesneria sp.]